MTGGCTRHFEDFGGTKLVDDRQVLVEQVPRLDDLGAGA